MNDLITIELKQLRFLAYHGLYAEEKKTGNQFVVDVTVSHLPVAGIITDLKETVNYVSLYNLICTEMQKPRHLLETFVMETTEIIHQVFPSIKKIEISITKLQPPIAAFTGSVGVSYSKEY
jgi:7,8-dihydroneopterin aldolase/epimerase/oxygenase